MTSGYYCAIFSVLWRREKKKKKTTKKQRHFMTGLPQGRRPALIGIFNRDLSRFETRSDDIYVVSFPKSDKAIDQSFRLASLLLFVADFFHSVVF